MLVNKLIVLAELFMKLEFIKLLLLVPGRVNVLLNIEVERLSLLIVTLQSKETSDCDSSIRQLILYCGLSTFQI